MYVNHFEKIMRPEVIKLLNNHKNYLVNYEPRKTLKCKLCEKRIDESKEMPLIFWEEDGTSFIPFHGVCVFKSATKEIINTFMEECNYKYLINGVNPPKAMVEDEEKEWGRQESPLLDKYRNEVSKKR
ncbi:MAG: hypothetical protein BAJALOKI2v1_340047 [Promethearchaeota archaeon]|nr:MAG: hypothetical protein BAJALOKI2v1_340047 [Candidatus Lokiarchaeota archaeon]